MQSKGWKPSSRVSRKAELLQLIINQIEGLGEIFQKKEYNLVQNDYESTNIYIKKQDVENLPPDANGIPVYNVDNNNNPTNNRHTLPIAVLTIGYVQIRKKVENGLNQKIANINYLVDVVRKGWSKEMDERNLTA